MSAYDKLGIEIYCIMLYNNHCPCRGVAQLVACLNGVQEAGSSNLLTPTTKESLKLFLNKWFQRFFIFVKTKIIGNNCNCFHPIIICIVVI